MSWGSAPAAPSTALAGRLHRIHRGVCAVGHRSLTIDGVQMAAVLACGGDALTSFRAAGSRWGLRHSDRIEVTTTRRGLTAPPGVRLHVTRQLHPDDRAEVGGVPVTSLARTIVDLAAVLRPTALSRVIREAEVLRLLDVAAIEEVLERRTAAGSVALRRALAQPGPGPIRSVLEERFLELCRAHGLPDPELNAHVAAGARLFEVDALWRGARLIVELDGAAVHHTRHGFHADRARDLALAAEGYLVVRLTWPRVQHDAPAVAAELRRVIALRTACVQD